MTVRMIEESGDETVRQRLRLVGIESPPEREDDLPAIPQKTKPPTREDVMNVMVVLTRILGFRFQLLLAFSGAVGLSAAAEVQQSSLSMIAAGVYAVLIFLPTLYVAYKRG